MVGPEFWRLMSFADLGMEVMERKEAREEFAEAKAAAKFGLEAVLLKS